MSRPDPPAAALATRALHALQAALPVRVADVRGVLHGVSQVVSTAPLDAGGVAEPQTLRELWARQQPSLAEQHAPMPFLETPAMRALGGNTVVREPLQLNRDGDRALVLVSAMPLHDDSGTVIGVLVMEESAPKQSLAVVGGIVSKLMHDVNNVLNPIMASAFLLQHHAESPAAVREYADRIRLAVESGTALSARVARFVRQGPVHAGGDSPIDVRALVDSVLTETSPGTANGPEGATIMVIREPGVALHARGLEAELRVAVGNLVQNAIEAMSGGGTLTVRTHRSGEDACITVSDTGVGMSADTLARAFEPFFSTRGAGHAGLGLSEVYGIMKRHRGSATIEPRRASVDVSGTTITLRLPAAAPDGEAEIPAAAQVESGPVHVLLVEDHDEGRDLLVRMLRTAGHTVATAQTCAEAKLLLADEPALPYHLLLTDVGLPDGNGWALVAYARARHSGLRIGVITGWTEDEDRIDMREAEFVLRKPLRATELLAHIAGGVRSTTR